MTAGRARARRRITPNILLLLPSACACLAIALVPALSRAHEFRPGLLDVASKGGGRFDVVWAPAPGGEKIQLVFPPGCAREPAAAARAIGEEIAASRFSIDCGAPGLDGQTLSVRGLAPLRDEVLVRIQLEAGPPVSAMLTAASPTMTVSGPAASSGAEASPAARPAWETIRELAWVGAAHLITGPDHVLFVLGLLLLVRRASALVHAITAFTLAHSLTLALSVLGAVQLSPPPVEAAIALSVLLLARELLRPAEARTLSQRRPWLVAFGFGLLHGLGFAGGLGALRVPAAQVPAALFGFNVGLELAQIALVLVVLGAARALAPVLARLPRWAHRAPAYGIGVAAAFWTLQRVTAFWT